MKNLISIRNIKTLEDLKEEQLNLNNQLKHLKLHKADQLHVITAAMLRKIQEYLNQFELEVQEQNNQISKGFVANYKSGYLRGEVSVDSNTLKIIYDGEEIVTIDVLPKLVHTIYAQSASIEEDILSEQIKNVEAEVRKIKDEIKAYEGMQIVYLVKDSNSNKVTTLLSTDEVIKYLFK